LNATFGNAPELIIAVVALSKGLSSVVKASITGSIIGNILPVFGLSILREGKGEPEEKSEELTGVLKDLRFKLTRDARSRLAFLQTEWQGPLLFRQLRAC